MAEIKMLLGAFIIYKFWIGMRNESLRGFLQITCPAFDSSAGA